jgi:hypothetical protein
VTKPIEGVSEKILACAKEKFLEKGISLGYAHLNYKRYGQSEGAALLEKSSCNYWGPTQAGISIIYFIR